MHEHAATAAQGHDMPGAREVVPSQPPPQAAGQRCGELKSARCTHAQRAALAVCTRKGCMEVPSAAEGEQRQVPGLGYESVSQCLGFQSHGPESASMYGSKGVILSS